MIIYDYLWLLTIILWLLMINNNYFPLLIIIYYYLWLLKIILWLFVIIYLWLISVVCINAGTGTLFFGKCLEKLMLLI